MSKTQDKQAAIQKLPLQYKYKYMLCRAIKYGTVKDVQRFRWFKESIECHSDTSALNKLKFDSSEIEPLFAILQKEDTKMHHEVFKFTLDLDLRLMPRGMTALHQAVDNGRIQTVAMLLYYGLDPNAVTVDDELPVQLAKSKNMRTVFGDFKQMARSKFAKKYALKIPPQPPRKRVFPFLELPRELQESIWQKVSRLHFWTIQFVSKEWRDYFLRKTNAELAGNINLYPRGQITESVSVAYYPTEFHFGFANDFLDLNRLAGSYQLVVNDLTREGLHMGGRSNTSDDDPDSGLPRKVLAVINLLQEEGSSVDFKEKMFFVSTKNHVDYYYIQKSEYFGIAIKKSNLKKLSLEQAQEAKRKQLLMEWQRREAEFDRRLQTQAKK